MGLSLIISKKHVSEEGTRVRQWFYQPGTPPHKMQCTLDFGTSRTPRDDVGKKVFNSTKKIFTLWLIKQVIENRKFIVEPGVLNDESTKVLETKNATEFAKSLKHRLQKTRWKAKSNGDKQISSSNFNIKTINSTMVKSIQNAHFHYLQFTQCVITLDKKLRILKFLTYSERNCSYQQLVSLDYFQFYEEINYDDKCNKIIKGNLI